jgi:hypothetical protein
MFDRLLKQSLHGFTVAATRIKQSPILRLLITNKKGKGACLLMPAQTDATRMPFMKAHT